MKTLHAASWLPAALMWACALASCSPPPSATTPSPPALPPAHPSASTPVVAPPSPTASSVPPSHAFGMVRISKGETITFSDGFSFAFLGHSHKRTYANDKSPLIVHGRYGLAEVSEDRYDSIQVPESRAWQWRAYQFRLVDHAYDDWMKLVVEKK